MKVQKKVVDAVETVRATGGASLSSVGASGGGSGGKKKKEKIQAVDLGGICDVAIGGKKEGVGKKRAANSETREGKKV